MVCVITYIQKDSKDHSDSDHLSGTLASISSYQKVWISSDSDTEEEENIDANVPESSDSDISERVEKTITHQHVR